MNTGNNLLFLTVSAMLSFMAVSGLLGWLNIRSLRFHLVVPDELYAGVETLLTLQVENRKRLLPSFLIAASVGEGGSNFLLLSPGRPERGSFSCSFPRRGVHQVPPVVISSPFPVNFFVRYRREALALSVTVFPAPRPLATLADADLRGGAFLRPSPVPGHEGELAKISDYRGGEALKLIHWRLSAKHEEFKVKELTAHAGEPVILELEALPGRDLEERVGVCCFLVNRLQKEGRAVGLQLPGRLLTPEATRAHRLRLLGELALYGQD